MRTSSSSLPRKRKRKDLSPPDTVLLVDGWRRSAGRADRHAPRFDIVEISRRTRRGVPREERRDGLASAYRKTPNEDRQAASAVPPLGERELRGRKEEGNHAGEGRREGRRGEARGRRRRSAEDTAVRSAVKRGISGSGVAGGILLLALICARCFVAAGEALAGTQKYCVRTITTRYGVLRGVEARSSTAVETYYGVPYATPPLGALRYMPPVTPTPWRGTKFADTMPPACPQRPPEPDASLPRQRRTYLERLAPMLGNQSEDCLYLNLYVPKPSPHGKWTTRWPRSRSVVALSSLAERRKPAWNGSKEFIFSRGGFLPKGNFAGVGETCKIDFAMYIFVPLPCTFLREKKSFRGEMGRWRSPSPK